MDRIETISVEYSPPEGKIVHDVDVSYGSSEAENIVHLTQSDEELPVIAVHLYYMSQPYIIPEGAAVNVRLRKHDKTYVYNPSLGVNAERDTAYIEVTHQMAAAHGLAMAIIEIVKEGVAGTGRFAIDFAENPVPDDVIRSTDEWKAFYSYIEQAEESANKSAEYERLASEHETAAEGHMTAAGKSAKEAGQSAKNAADSETAAGKAQEAAEEFATLAKSYARGETGSRDGEDTDNAEAYAAAAATDARKAEDAAELAKQIAESGLKPLAFTIALPASAWADGAQTVKDARILAGDQYAYMVDLAGQLSGADDVTVAGQMTFHADVVPSGAVTVDIVRLEVAT